MIEYKINWINKNHTWVSFILNEVEKSREPDHFKEIKIEVSFNVSFFSNVVDYYSGVPYIELAEDGNVYANRTKLGISNDNEDINHD